MTSRVKDAARNCSEVVYVTVQEAAGNCSVVLKMKLERARLDYHNMQISDYRYVLESLRELATEIASQF